MSEANPFQALLNSGQSKQIDEEAQPKEDATERLPRIVTYHQTHFHNNQYISPLPLLSEDTGCTHVIIAAIHLNDDPGDITVNDDHYTTPKLAPLLTDIQALKNGDITVMGLLGGAAKGTFTRLDGASLASFDTFYNPLLKAVRHLGLQGLDLDVEENMSLSGIIRLILALKADMGSSFVISLAPVAAAMIAPTPHSWLPSPLPRRNISGFCYFELEKAAGRHISFYNCQFYNGWGSFESVEMYERIVHAGWDARKIVAGVPTSREVAGSGHVDDEIVCVNTIALMDLLGPQGFGGIMGWEYWNSFTSDMDSDDARLEYWRWCRMIGNAVKTFT